MVKWARLFTGVSCLAISLQACKEKPPGQKLYGPNCAICHHGGAGQAGAFPPLIGRVDVIARTADGRKFLAATMINGLNGPILANKLNYDYAMPPFERLSDHELSLIINWLISRGQTHPTPSMSPRDFAEARRLKIGSVGTHRMRGELQASGLIP